MNFSLKASFRACKQTAVSFIALCFSLLTIAYVQTSFASQSSGVALEQAEEGALKSYKLKILSGTVTIEGGFCAGRCPTRVSNLSGTFTADFGKNAGSSYYPMFVASNIISEPRVGFQLPEYPHTEDSVQPFETGNPDIDVVDLPMTVNRVEAFEFDGETLSIQGVLEPSQFVADLPTTSYEIRAKVINSDFAYYVIERDLRECAFPLCGGYFIKKVNNDMTPCLHSNGVERSRCYVESIQWLLGGEQLKDRYQPLLVKGALSSAYYKKASSDVSDQLLLRPARLLITEANRPVSKKHQDLSGTFAAVKNNGIVCITQPCPSYDMMTLNTKGEQKLSSLDYRSVSVSPDDLEQIERHLKSEKGLLGSGMLALRLPVNGKGGERMTSGHFSYTQIYLPIKQEAPGPDAVWVEKWNGAYTCQPESARPLEESRAELTSQGIAVQESQCGNLSGMFIPAVCNIQGLGIHLHSIRAADVAKAEGLGFDLITEDKFRITECPEQVATPDAVVISKAVYKKRRGELRVIAYSDEPGVELTVEGYGVMKFHKRKGVYRLKVKDITDPGKEVTVRSSAGGIATKAIKFR